MEGYLNLDSGTLNPYRHGEVFVLDDGLETDMDLGTYERLLDQDLSRDNYVTSGQIFRKVLEKERLGGYLGRDVQMIPHVTGEVKYMLRDLAMKQDADVVFIEVGGTVGDLENTYYIEALRQLAFEGGRGQRLLRRAHLRHRAPRPRRAKNQGGPARAQEAARGGGPAPHHRRPRQEPGQPHRQGKGGHVLQRADGPRVLDARPRLDLHHPRVAAGRRDRPARCSPC